MSNRGSPNRRVPVVVGLIAFLIVGLFSVTARPVHAAQGDVGQAGPSFAGSGADPTGTKPESKVWYNDGFWWASMYSSTASAFTIHKLSGTTWTNTGVVIDDRETTHSDILWDQGAGKLYVASHVYNLSPATGNPARLLRYSYNTGSDTYTLDGGFPQTITDWSSETLVLDKDSTGQLWATWTRGNRVRVNRTTNGDQTWGAEFQLPTDTTALNSDDISTIVAFGGNKVGVLWSNQNGSPSTTDAFHFSIHDDSANDTTWGAQTPIFAGTNHADDHLNLKADPAGNLYAVVKTSMTAAGDPNIVVLRRSTGGTWTNAIFSTRTATANPFTRGVVAVDTTNNQLHVFASSPETNGTVYEKTSPLSSLSLPSGMGTAFINDNSSKHLNNSTTTKQTVDSTTGLLVLAGHETLNQYWFNVESLGGGPPPTPTPTPTPTPGGSTITLTPAADAQVKSTSATTNFGSDVALTTREDAVPANVTYRSYLQFNVAGLTGTVGAVKLRLFVNDVSTNTQNVYSSPNGWAESTINWNNAPLLGATILGGTTAPTINTYIEIPLPVSAVTGNGPVSFAVKSTGTASAVFNSKEVGANPPQLVITQTVASGAPPVANADSRSTLQGVPVTFDLTGTDPDTCGLTFAVTVQPTKGLVTAPNSAAGCSAGVGNPDSASVTYTPSPASTGADQFTFTVSDGVNPPVSAVISLTINAKPTASGSTQTTPMDTALSVTLAGGDLETCDLTFAFLQPAHGTVASPVDGVCVGPSPNTDSQSVTYTPTTGYNGLDSFTFTVSDGSQTSAPATVSITVGTPPNLPPTPSPVTKSTPHDVAATVNLSGTDPEDCELTFAAGVAPAHGSLGSIADATCVGGSPKSDSATILYTPAAGYHGGDSFTYTVNDGTNPAVSATVSITVTNVAPIANGSSQTTLQGTPKTFDLTGTDVDDCGLTFAILVGPTKGIVSSPNSPAGCTGSNPFADSAPVTYTPAAGQTGNDSFTFTVSDGVNTSASATVNLTITASAPTTATFLPVADSQVSSSNLAGNYGTLTTMKAREGDGSSANPNYRDYLKFSVSGVTGTVSSVKLRLFVTDASTDLHSVFVVTDNSWTETAINYNNAPSLTGLTAVGSATVPTLGAYVEITLAPTTVSSSTTTLSLAIKCAGTASSIFSTREDATNKPQLTVTFQ